MTKADMKPGYVLETRNRGLFMVLPIVCGDLCAVNKEGKWFGVEKELCDDLSDPRGNKDWDVMAVYGFSEYAYNSLELATRTRKLLWKRPEAKKMTVKEVCAALGYDVEIVKEVSDGD